MSYPTHDTDWAESQWGNHWRRVNGIPLIVGRSSYGGNHYWASVDREFLDVQFETLGQAKAAAEAELQRLENLWYMGRSYDY
jgi:hypothetical protein